MATTKQGSLAADATSFLAENENTVESLSGSPSEIRRQAYLLAEWARKRGVLLPDNYTVGLDKFQTRSTEHEVFLRTADRRVVKCTYPGAFGFVKDRLDGKPRKATPLYYLRRLELMNKVFGDDLVLEGVAFGTPQYGKKSDPMPFLIISQSFIETVGEKFCEPSEQEIADFMVSLGFSQLSDSVYQWYRESDKIVVSDAKPANFIKSIRGVIPIDLLISKITPATI
jgi:hypothetical protein